MSSIQQQLDFLWKVEWNFFKKHFFSEYFAERYTGLGGQIMCQKTPWVKKVKVCHGLYVLIPLRVWWSSTWQKARIMIIDGNNVNYVKYVNTVNSYYQRQYKSSRLQVFFRIDALKNSEGSLENADSGGLQVFRKSSLINIYYKFIFWTWQLNQITCEYFTLTGWKLTFLYYPSDLPAVVNKVAHSRPKKIIGDSVT